MLGEARDCSKPLSPSPRMDLYLSCGAVGFERGGLGSGTNGGKYLFGTGVGRFEPGELEEGTNITPSLDPLIFSGNVFDGTRKQR